MADRVERRQQFRGGFRTKKDAQRALIDALAALGKGTYVDPARQSMSAYLLEEWLPSKKPAGGGGRRHRGQLGVGTWNDYRGLVRAYILPHLGATPLSKLSPADLNAFYDVLEQRGGKGGRRLSAKTVLNVHRMLHKALGDAVRLGRLSRNPVGLVQPPSASRGATDVWSVQQLRAFLKHVSTERYYAAWLLFATTGMRRGEVAGLAWSDIDLAAAKLRVRATLGLVNGHPTWKPRPKTAAAERTMSLDPDTVDALRAHRRTQAEERLGAGLAWCSTQTDHLGQSRDDLVFTWPDGSLMSPDRFTRWFRKLSADAGLPRIRLHDVRHTYATAGLANARGWHEVKVISERLGHASIGITLDTYSHVLPVADEETAHTLARVILGR
jgi:integrase